MKMKPRKIVLIALIAASLLAIHYSCATKNKANAHVTTIDVTPFTILKTSTENKSFNMNYGRKSSVGYTDYKVLYNGEAIQFPATLEQNTGLSGVWKAYILKDAPKPTILAGSQSLYLITEENNAAKVTPLDEQNSEFASIQWLDKENGQPSSNQEVYISNDSSATCFLEGGEYLLINKTTVLMISDLAVFHFDRYQAGIDYNAAKVVAFSPDKNEIVFVSSKYNGEKYIYALMVFDFKKNKAYAVPFDQTETRMQDEHDIDATWINTFFEWQKTKEGNYIFKKRELAQLPLWQGRFSDKDTYYNILPAKEEMRHVLADFVLKTLDLDSSAVQANNAGDNIDLYIQYGNLKFNVGYWANLKNVHFSKYLYETESEESLEIVKRIGNDFNEELSKGKYQEFFTTY